MSNTSSRRLAMFTRFKAWLSEELRKLFDQPYIRTSFTY
jgi:hypothetical protein